MALSPVQWLVAQPVLALSERPAAMPEVQQQAVAREDAARKERSSWLQRAELADELIKENEHLRSMLELRERSLDARAGGRGGL